MDGTLAAADDGLSHARQSDRRELNRGGGRRRIVSCIVDVGDVIREVRSTELHSHLPPYTVTLLPVLSQWE